ncbi:MAG: hypothetical protein ACKOC4_12080 [Planctomycetia bacterium]
MTLIGSAALLWHAADRGLDVPLPENSMDVDPATDSDALAWMCYDALATVSRAMGPPAAVFGAMTTP